MSAKQKHGKSSSHKLGRSSRPGQKAKMARYWIRLVAKKRRRILRSNGAAYLADWERRRLAA